MEIAQTLTWNPSIPRQCTVNTLCIALDKTVSEVVVWRIVTGSFSSVKVSGCFEGVRLINLGAILSDWVNLQFSCWHGKFVGDSCKEVRLVEVNIIVFFWIEPKEETISCINAHRDIVVQCVTPTQTRPSHVPRPKF